jgi:serine/threonine protein phosphatase 1
VVPGVTRPIFRRNMILLDTVSYLVKGHISCVDVISGKFWQSKDSDRK